MEGKAPPPQLCSEGKLELKYFKSMEFYQSCILFSTTTTIIQTLTDAPNHPSWEENMGYFF